MNVPSLLVRSAVFAAAAILLFPYRIEAQQVRAKEGVRPDEMADLVAVAITPSIAFPEPKEMVDIAVQVQNRSTRAERNVVVTLFAGVTRVAEKMINLKSGETATVHLSWKATVQGKVTLTARIDPNSQLIELDRYDNLISTDLVVTRRPSYQADLAIIKLESVQRPDQSTVLRVHVRNKTKVRSQVPLVFRIDKHITEVRLADVAAETTVTVDVPFVASQLAGQVSAEVNPRHRSKERNPDDNLLVTDLRPAIDLRIEGLSVSATQFEQERPRQVTISFRVVNAGATAISKTFRTSIIPGIVRSDKAQPFGVSFVTTAGLPIGGTVYISHSIVSPVSEFDIRVETDADNTIAEADENNNIAVSHFKNPTPDVGRWVSIGPTRVNDGGLGAIGRIHSIAVHPTTPNTMYVGGPKCGIWKTTDGGTSWAPVGDSLPTLALAALGVDPVTPTRVYAVLAGNGIYRSNDAAASWTQISGDVGTPAGAGVLLIDPTTPSRLYLTAGANGLYRSTDSGANWTLVKSGIVNDLVMDPSNTATLYTGVQSDGVYKTTTGGAAGDSAWTKLRGLPASGFTRITLALSAADPKTIYAGVSGAAGAPAFSLFRATDGATFSPRFSTPPPPPGYYNPWIGVDPTDPSIVYSLSAQFWRSTDGGLTFNDPIGDSHECQKFAADPVMPGVIYLGRDNGIFRSADQGTTFTQIGGGIINVEIYDGALATTDPKIMIAGTQDNGTIRFDGTSTIWTEFSGGDGATVDIDPSNSTTLYTMNQGQGSMVRWDNGNVRCIGCSLPPSPPTTCSNLHFQVHPVTPSTLLASCLALWRANNPQCPQCPGSGSAGTPGVWTAILPASVTAPATVLRSAIDPTNDIYYAGTSNGDVWAAPSGANWQRVFTPSAVGSVTDLEIDLDNPTIVYLSVQRGFGDRIYRLRRSTSVPTAATTTALPITGDLPFGLTVQTLAIDRMTPFTIYAGTNQGVFRGRSIDNGTTWSWTAYTNGMPPAADVRDLEVHPVTGVMRAATYGRSAFEVNTDFPVGSVLTAEGKVTTLRVHDVGSGFGPPTDLLDADVIVLLDTQPGKGFGFTLRDDSDKADHRGMLKLFRLAFAQNRTVKFDYVRTGLKNGRIIRVETVN